MRNEEKILLSQSFEPREYQKHVFDAIENRGYRKALLVWPRRAGKDITVWHLILRQALRRKGIYFYCLPTYSQCRSVIWNAIRSDEISFLDMIPKSLIKKINSSDMSITLDNGSRIQLIGSDAYDRSLVGSNALGVIFSEFSRADPNAYKYASPILQANGGFCVILSTPYGHNSFYDLYNIAKSNPQEWFCQHLTLDDTRHISTADIRRQVEMGEISEDLARQEYWCSFEAGALGAYYAKYIERLHLNGQIGFVEYLTHVPVVTAWDLGIRDSTVIIFVQILGSSIRIFDYYENKKMGLEHYCKEVLSRPYIYKGHIAPHDINVQEFGSGITRFETAHDMGIDFTIAPKVPLMDGIEKVRATLSSCRIDQERCAKFIKHIENYRQEWDSKRNVYKANPLHDESSHCCDALRYLCVTYSQFTSDTTAEVLEERYKKAMTKDISQWPFTQRPF